MDKSIDRRHYIEQVFSNENIIRVRALDGMLFSNGAFDKASRPIWDQCVYNALVAYKIIGYDAKNYYSLYPTEFACNFSHRKAWVKFIKSGCRWGIFLEDDVEFADIKTFKNILNYIPNDCDFFYLCNESHPGNRLMLYSDSQVKWSRTLMAYMISNRFAIQAIEAMLPVYYQTDWQIPFRLFKSFENTWREQQPNWREFPRFKAYGLKTNDVSIIKHSHFANTTTFTQNGRKDWLDNDSWM